MKRIIYVSVLFLLAACQQSKIEKFTLDGELSGAPDQEVYLEQITFDRGEPQVLDTAELKDGKFTLKANSKEEGLYRVRLQNHPGFFVINDKEDIHLVANVNDSTLKSVKVNSPATTSLYKLFTTVDSLDTQFMLDEQARQMYMQSGNDSMAAQISNNFQNIQNWFKDFTFKYADTAKSPVVALYAFSFSMNINEDKDAMAKLIKDIQARWPENSSVKQVAQQYETITSQQNQSPQQMKQGLAVGTEAPEITMNDTDGKPFSLSQLRGKYVLVDFWASWCGPCRMENPNLVRAFNKYKDKNFTILGVSLDQTKDAWLKGIKDDHLDWKQISDLKFWESAAVPLYQIQGIPYNVLLDPQGKIIASELRGSALDTKLAEVLK